MSFSFAAPDPICHRPGLAAGQRESACRGDRLRFDWFRSISARLPATSARAFLFALAMLAVATLLRIGFGKLGATLYFATFFPAILIVALLAGPYAGAFSIVGTVVIVWWAFIAPVYTFERFGIHDVANIGMFVFASGLIVWLAYWYREAVHALDRRDAAQSLLLKELAHRGRNTFAIVESIVRNTLPHSPADADTIIGRVRAVSTTNDLVNESVHHKVALSKLLAMEFTPYGLHRMAVRGVEVELSANTARNVALVVHELTTNAVKYGALKVPDGRLAIDWKRTGNTIELIWEERDGPAVVSPIAQGFGTKLLTRCMQSLGGSIEPQFRREGLICRIVFELRD
jgi:two-component sensor histidine kinase